MCVWKGGGEALAVARVGEVRTVGTSVVGAVVAKTKKTHTQGESASWAERAGCAWRLFVLLGVDSRCSTTVARKFSSDI